ncbi:hypothetical protein [Microbacterium sp. NPDC097977]|uniref:hypothetical protein n=1 Tax=Microbacterium sp. NPDC097977 TaxID=3155686 RepID=UPI00332249CF
MIARPAGFLGQSRTIASLTLRVWSNEFTRQFGGSRATSRAMIGVLVALLAGWQLLGVVPLLMGQTAVVPAALQVQMVSEQLTMAAAMSLCLLTIVLVVSPSRTAVDDLLAPYPVRAAALRFGSHGVLLGSACAAALLFTLPFIVPAVPLISERMRVLLVLAWMLVCCASIAAGWALFRGATWLSRTVLRVPSAFGRSLASFALIAGVIAILALRVRLPWADSVLVGSTVALGAAAVCVVFLLLGTGIPSDVREAGDGAIIPIAARLGRRVSVPGRERTIVRIELTQWMRSSLVVAAETLTVLVAVAIALMIGLGVLLPASVGFALLVAAAGGSAMFGFGVTAPYRWIRAAVAGRRGQASATRVSLAAAVVVASVITLCVMVLLVATGMLSVSDVIAALPAMVLSFCAAFAAGVLFPVSPRQNMSSLFTLLLALLLTVGAGVALQQIASDWGRALSMVVVGVGALALAFTVVRRREPLAHAALAA